jgi:NAD(P)-dependent dehydrogenase (short-subunit alcohol dehydrogenase family)
MTKRICVTGASGRAGRVTVRELLAHGYRVVATDRVNVNAAADTVMDRPSAELLAEVYPGVTLNREVGEFGTLLAIDRAREALGFTPQHSWRDHVDPRSPRP